MRRVFGTMVILSFWILKDLIPDDEEFKILHIYLYIFIVLHVSFEEEQERYRCTPFLSKFEALYVDWACMQGFTVILVYKWVDEEY